MLDIFFFLNNLLLKWFFSSLCHAQLNYKRKPDCDAYCCLLSKLHDLNKSWDLKSVECGIFMRNVSESLFELTIHGVCLRAKRKRE